MPEVGCNQTPILNMERRFIMQIKKKHAHGQMRNDEKRQLPRFRDFRSEGFRVIEISDYLGSTRSAPPMKPLTPASQRSQLGFLSCIP